MRVRTDRQRHADLFRQWDAWLTEHLLVDVEVIANKGGMRCVVHYDPRALLEMMSAAQAMTLQAPIGNPYAQEVEHAD